MSTPSDRASSPCPPAEDRAANVSPGASNPFRSLRVLLRRSKEVFECTARRCACRACVINSESQLTLPIGRRKMRRGESKAKSPKRGGRTRSVAAKPKTPVRRKDVPATILAEQLAAKTRELDEALQQQLASSEVLQIISSSPGKLEPVFDTILKNATRICDAQFGNLILFDGETYRTVAFHN